MEQRTRATAVGAAALVATVLLWSSFALSSRALGATGLTPLDTALLRFATPVVLLAPWAPRTLRSLRGAPLASLALVLAGGLPHFLVYAWGARLTSAGLTGLLVPGTVPLFVALLLFAARGERVARGRLLSLGLLVCGVVASATLVSTGAGLLGVGVLLAAGLAWAVYTVGLQGTGLDVVGVALVLGVVSTAGSLLLAVTGALPSGLLTGGARLPDVALCVVVQGVGTGVLSTLCYVTAVQRLGGSTTAVAGALSPVVTAVVAVPLLGEPLPPGLAVALACIAVGVLTYGLPRRARPRALPAPRAAAPLPVG